MTSFIINCKVSTPLGDGLYQSMYASSTGAQPTTRVLVRLPINDDTRKHLNKSNCLTPRAIISGLWTFDASEVK